MLRETRRPLAYYLSNFFTAEGLLTPTTPTVAIPHPRLPHTHKPSTSWSPTGEKRSGGAGQRHSEPSFQGSRTGAFQTVKPALCFCCPVLLPCAAAAAVCYCHVLLLPCVAALCCCPVLLPSVAA